MHSKRQTKDKLLFLAFELWAKRLKLICPGIAGRAFA